MDSPSLPQSSHSPARSFATTQWTKVLAAKGESPDAKIALSDLCECYYTPVQQFIRWRVSDPEKAKDLTHDFFEYLLSRPAFEGLDPNKSKFRTYLLGAVKHFLSRSVRKDSALKRGAGQAQVSLSTNAGDTPSLAASAGDASNDERFDYQWGLNVMARALSALERDFAGSDRQAQFDALKPWLVGQVDTLSQKEVAQTLGLSEGAVKVAIHRLRRRFKETIKSEIKATLGSDDTVDEELRYLVDVLS